VFGMSMEGKYIKGVPYLFSNFCYVFYNLLGDITYPKYDVWLDRYNSKSQKGSLVLSAGRFIIVIQIIFQFSQIFLMVILMNFLIAVVNEQY